MESRCDVCGNRLQILYDRVTDPLTKERFSVHRCSECGLGHTVPRPPKLEKYYGPIYYGNRHAVTLKVCLKRRINIVSRFIRGVTSARLLDVGCGDGSFLVRASARGWQGCGVEVNPDVAAKIGFDVRKTLSEWEKNGPFDAVTMWHSLEHMADVRETLGRIRDLLSPNGVLIVSVPDFGGLNAKLCGRHWFALDVPRHLYHFDRASLVYALNKCGFYVQRFWHHEWEYDLMGWAQSAVSLLNIQSATPNEYFHLLTGKKTSGHFLHNVLTMVSGGILTALSVPITAMSAALHLGGTLIVVARRNPASSF